jgi:pimeloyl-ACP methyl ester carboxylesterase
VSAPALRIRPATGPVTAIVIVLGGGRAVSTAKASRRNLSYLRMLPFAAIVHRDLRTDGVEVWQLRYRVRGWNRAARDPVTDVRWALARVARDHPGVPVVLVGHSMGGRTALYAAGDAAVVGVVGLAPWIERGDPHRQTAGRIVVIAHGDLDRMTDPRNSRTFAIEAAADGATVAHFVVAGEKHAMLRRAGDWHRLVRDSVRVMLGKPGGGQVAAVLAGPVDERLDVPLGRGSGVDAAAQR